MSLLHVNNLKVTYNDVVLVLRGLSFQVPEGSVVALLGSNGAGKTTTLKALTGLLRYEDGEVEDGQMDFDGEPLRGLPPERIVELGLSLVPQGRRVFEDLSVEENLRIGGFRRPDQSEVRGECELFLGQFPRLRQKRHQPAGLLSGGEQQMLVLGRALLARPKLLLLDEPSLGLAPLHVAEAFRTLRHINRDLGTTILVVEQNAGSALAIAEYCYVMENGRIVIDGTSEELLANEDVQEFYLGMSDLDQRRRYDAVKAYRRRKRWLS